MKTPFSRLTSFSPSLSTSPSVSSWPPGSGISSHLCPVSCFPWLRTGVPRLDQGSRLCTGLSLLAASCLVSLLKSLCGTCHPSDAQNSSGYFRVKVRLHSLCCPLPGWSRSGRLWSTQAFVIQLMCLLSPLTLGTPTSLLFWNICLRDWPSFPPHPLFEAIVLL